MNSIRVVIYGALGRASRIITDILYHEPEIEVAGAVGREVWDDRHRMNSKVNRKHYTLNS